MCLNYSSLSVACALCAGYLSMMMFYVLVYPMWKALVSFSAPSNIQPHPIHVLKIELICKFMCILLFHPYHVMILAALLMDFLNQFNT